jgi:hypothetical protein
MFLDITVAFWKDKDDDVCENDADEPILYKLRRSSRPERIVLSQEMSSLRRQEPVSSWSMKRRRKI